MRNHFYHQKGFSLVEVLIATSILALVSLGVIQLTDVATVNSRRVEDASKEPRLFNSMISKIMADIQNFPGKTAAANNGLLDATLFDNPQVAENMCFTSSGLEVATSSKLCRFKVDMYRSQVRDASFKASGDIGTLPLERVFFRFKDLEAEKKNIKREKIFSKIVTKMIVN